MKAGRRICAVEDARYRILEYNLCPRMAPAIYATNNTWLEMMQLKLAPL